MVKKKDSTFWMSIFILVIMVFSIAGFAMLSGGGVSSSNPDGLPSELPLQQFEQDGAVFWGAIRNNEQFIFQSIEGYDASLAEIGLANKIKSTQIVSIYVDERFNESGAIFLVEKALRGIKIDSQKVFSKECNSNTLVFTTNELFEGECMKFVSSNEEAYRKAEILVYHLIKE